MRIGLNIVSRSSNKAMDTQQEDFERGVGDRFAEWLTSTTSRKCTFLRRGDAAPDLIYEFDSSELLIEITAAYYDDDHAKFLWKGAKQLPDAPMSWAGVNPDQNLANAIQRRVEDKSTKRYGKNVALLIEVPPGVTTAERLERLLKSLQLPSIVPFVGIYAVGRFPMSTDSDGGFRVITIKAIVQ